MARTQDKRNSRRRGGITIPSLSGIEGRVLVAEGDYHVKVKEVIQEEGQNGDYLSWKFTVIGGKHDGATLYYNTSLLPQALWNLKSLLETLEVDIPDDEFDLDDDDVVDRELMVTVEHDTYNGKKQARVVDFAPAEAETSSKKDSSKKDDDKGGDDEDRNKRRRERRAERRGRDKDDDKSSARDNKRSSRDDDKRGGKNKKAKAISQDEVNDMGEDELADLIGEHDLEVDLDQFSTLRRKKAAVIDALEEAGQLAD